MSANIKTWQERLREMHSEDGRYGYVQIASARDAEIADLRAALAAKAVPDGWKMVPVEPTIEMVAAFGWAGDEDLAIGHAWISKGIADDYKAMLAVAPSPAEPSHE